MDFFAPLPIQTFAAPVEGTVMGNNKASPIHQVSYRGSIWLAKSADNNQPVIGQNGQVVQIIGRQGNTLLIQP